LKEKMHGKIEPVFAGRFGVVQGCMQSVIFKRCSTQRYIFSASAMKFSLLI
jgi:hypothetical protein